MLAPIRKKVLAGFVLVALAIASFIVFETGDFAPADRSDSIDAGPADVEKPRYRTEKSKRTKIAGYADLYAAYHRHIRTASGSAGPAYPANYRFDELTKAQVARKTSAEAIPWVERGPGNVSGRTRAIVVDPDDPTHSIWIAGSVSGGLWKTTDAGDTWIELAPELPNLAISSLAQAASNPDVLYAGTGEGFFSIDHVAGDGIFKSVDRGDTWTQLSSTAANLDFRYVNRLLVNPNDENVVVAATRSGIYRSADGGSTWDRVFENPQPIGGAIGSVQDLAAQPGNFQIQIAGVYGKGVARSADGGQSWSLVDGGLVGAIGRVEVAFAPSDPSRVYAAVEQGGSSGLHMSSDGGVSWTPVVETLTSADTNWLGAQGWYDNSIAVHPFFPDSVFVGGIELWKLAVSADTRQIETVTGVDEENTDSFLAFINFGAPYFGGALQTGDNEGAIDVTSADFVTVELRFGPGISQRAHRFVPDDGPGIPLNTYPYADYASVPFEAWDLANDRQLMVSFRDRLHDGEFDLIARDDDNLGREYVFVHASAYDADNPHPEIAKDGGTVYKLLYFTWPILAPGGIWDAENLPESILRINYDSFTARLRSTQRLDAQNQFGERVHVDHHDITIIPIDESTNSYKVVNGNDGGIYRSFDSGRTWDKASGGYNTTQFYGVDKKPDVPVYIGGTQDNGTWISFANPNPTSGWTHRIGGDGFDAEWHDEDPNLVLGTVFFNFIQRSDNGGTSFVDAYGPKGESLGLTDNGPDKGPFITTLATTPADPDRVFTIGISGVWRSTDFGDTWILSRIPAAELGFHNGGSVAASPTNADVVWAGFYMDGTRSVHVSTNGGRIFSPTVSSPLSPGPVSGLATDPRDDRTAYALFSAYGRAKVLQTRDLGQTWEDLSGFGEGAVSSSNGFPNVAVYDLLVLPDRRDELWAGTEIGLFISQDDGATWQYADNGLPAVSIWKMRVVDDEIVVATHGRGIWTVPLNAVPVSSEVAAELPAEFSLAANYPNPFNPATTITFDVPVASQVRLTVFDVTGRRIASLVNREFAPGRHQVVWDARGVASGLYFYRLESGEFEATRSMTLLK